MDKTKEKITKSKAHAEVLAGLIVGYTLTSGVKEVSISCCEDSCLVVADGVEHHLSQADVEELKAQVLANMNY